MKRRDFLKASAAGFASLLDIGLGQTVRPEPMDRASSPWKPKSNILFIFIDDMGYADPSCFGNPKVKTPNIDRLAAEGMRLTNFYVNSPICSPSRVAVMTGTYPARWDIHSYLASRKRNADRGMANWLDPKAPTTARILKNAGYATAHFGKWHIGGGRDVGDAPLPSEYGFDESLVCFEGLGDRILFPDDGLCRQSRKLGRGRILTVPKHESTENYVDRAIAFMQKSKEGGRSFYIELFPNDVHDAHLPKGELRAKYEKTTDNPYEQKFLAVLEELDRQIGRLADAVDRLGLAEETLTVFTSDNGPTDWPSYYKQGHNPPGFTGPFFGRKWSLYEGGIRMPFIARYKGVIPTGKVNDESIMCGIDLAPTFCSVAGVVVPTAVNFDGLDMTRALLGEPIERAEPIFWQYGDPHAQLKPGNPHFRSPSLAVRDGRWKLLINADGSEARLYDLQADPGESNNLVGNEPELARELWRKIRRWAQNVGHETQDAPPVAPRT